MVERLVQACRFRFENAGDYLNARDRGVRVRAGVPGLGSIAATTTRLIPAAMMASVPAVCDRGCSTVRESRRASRHGPRRHAGQRCAGRRFPRVARQRDGASPAR